VIGQFVAEIIPQIPQVDVVVLGGEFLHGLHSGDPPWLLASLDVLSISHYLVFVNSFLKLFYLF
jgi:hypothetical protein